MTAMLLKYKLRSILSDPVRECLCLIRSAVRFWFFSHVCQNILERDRAAQRFYKYGDRIDIISHRTQTV